MVFDNPIVRWLAASRRELKSRLWQSFERSIGSYLLVDFSRFELSSFLSSVFSIS